MTPDQLPHEVTRLVGLFSVAGLPIEDRPTRFQDGSYSLFQSPAGADLRLYLSLDAQGRRVFTLTTYFLPDSHKIPPLVDPSDTDLLAQWKWAVDQHHYTVDLDALKDALTKAGFPCATHLLTVVQGVRLGQDKARQDVRDWEAAHPNTRAALVALLRTTADKVEAHKGGLVIHDVHDHSDEHNFFVGATVVISGYLGG